MTMLFFYKPIYGNYTEAYVPPEYRPQEVKKRKKRTKEKLEIVETVEQALTDDAEWKRIKSEISAEIDEIRLAANEIDIAVKREAIRELRAWFTKAREEEKLQAVERKRKRRRKDERELLLILELLDE